MNRKLKILHLGYSPPDQTYSNDGSFFAELQSQSDVVFVDIKKIGNPEIIDDKISKILKNNKFDIIYKNFIKAFDTKLMRPLHEYGMPVFLSAGDCHTRLISNILNDRSNHHKYHTIIANNGSAIPCFKEYFDRDMNYIWLPWSYNPSVHKDYGKPKKYDACIPASHLKIKLRRGVHDYLNSSKYNYLWIRGLQPESYGQTINECKIGISTCQVDSKQGKSCHYYNNRWIGMTFNKWYEVTMCGSLHMGQKSGDFDALDFIDGENSVCFENLDEFKDKFNFYINNDSERERVIKNARKIIEPMNYENRAKDFLKQVKEII
jgi:hypothetical protein